MHVPSKTTPVPSLAWLLELVGVAAFASALGAQSALLWLGVILLLLGLWLLEPLLGAPALQLWGVWAGQWANSRRSSRSPTPVWCSLATAASPQDPAGPEHSPTASPPLVDIGPDNDAPLRMPGADVQQHLDTFGIDARKVVRRCPAVAKYDVERVQHVSAYLAELKVDVKHAVETHPNLLAGQME
eukprot:EG_transcript_28515